MKYKVAIRYGLGDTTEVYILEWSKSFMLEFFDQWDTRFTCGCCRQNLDFDDEWWSNNTNFNPHSIMQVTIIDIISEKE